MHHAAIGAASAESAYFMALAPWPWQVLAMRGSYRLPAPVWLPAFTGFYYCLHDYFTDVRDDVPCWLFPVTVRGTPPPAALK